MNDTVSALVTAGGALAAALFPVLLAQRGADRLRRKEAARRERARWIMLRAVEERKALDNRRGQYTDFNTAVRQYLTELTNLLHALSQQAHVPSVVESLEAARAAHLLRYAQTQLIASEPVLLAARRVNRELNALYGLLRRLTEGTATSCDSFAAAQQRITALWDVELAALRHSMRADLRPNAPAHH